MAKSGIVTARNWKPTEEREENLTLHTIKASNLLKNDVLNKVHMENNLSWTMGTIVMCYKYLFLSCIQSPNMLAWP